jgi:hypothetical protein
LLEREAGAQIDVSATVGRKAVHASTVGETAREATCRHASP